MYGVVLAESDDEIEPVVLDNVLSELSEFAALESEAPGLRTAFVSWTQGLLFRKIGVNGAALSSLRRAADLFRSHGIPGHFAIARIDFAVLAATTHRIAEAREAVLQAVDGLEAFKLTKEQNVAALVLAKAATDEWDLKLLQLARDRFVGKL